MDDSFNSSADVDLLLDGSRIEVIVDSPTLLEIYIPSGSQRTVFLGRCMLLAWGILCCAEWQGWLNGPPIPPKPPAVAIREQVIFCLVWGLTIFLSLYWVRLHFERMTLRLERDRLILERVLFGWKWNEDVPLGKESRAMLLENYRNTPPVHWVVVAGERARAKFGIKLSELEKLWLVRRMNRFLEAAPALPGFEEERSAADARSASSLLLRPLPMPLCPTGVKVLESTDECLTLYIPGGGPQVRMPRIRPLGICSGLLALAIQAEYKALQGGNPVGIVMASLFLAGMLAAIGYIFWRWIRVRFPATVFQLDRERAVLKQSLLHFEWLSETTVMADSRAEVVEAYQEKINYQVHSVCQVAFYGKEAILEFGLPLANLEKEWLAQQINEFLQATAPA